MYLYIICSKNLPLFFKHNNMPFLQANFIYFSSLSFGS